MPDRGLLPGSPAITRTGLAPVGLVQFPGRNMCENLIANGLALLAGGRRGPARVPTDPNWGRAPRLRICRRRHPRLPHDTSIARL